MYEQQINAYFDAPARRAQLVEAVSRLVRIRSVREEPQPGMPFGPGPAAALDEALKLAGELGFATKNYDNYVGRWISTTRAPPCTSSATWTWWGRAPAGR